MEIKENKNYIDTIINKTEQYNLDNQLNNSSIHSFNHTLKNNNIFNFKSINLYNIDKAFLFSSNIILLALKYKNTALFLQKNLEGISSLFINYIIMNLKNKFRSIIKTINGNYFVTDLMKRCNIEQRLIIIKELSFYIYKDCKNIFATHTLQSIISSSEEEYRLLLLSFDDNNTIIEAAIDECGNYVIRYLIIYIPQEKRKEFNLKFVKFIYNFSQNKYAMLAVKDFILYTKDNYINFEILYIVLTYFYQIATNEFGNFIIQILLKSWWNKKECFLIKNKIKANFEYLEGNKYSYFICKLFKKLNKGL